MSSSTATGIDSNAKPAVNPVYRRRMLMHRFGIALSVIAMSIGLIALLWILVTLVIKGLGGINIAMFTQTTPAPGSEGGGLLNAIVGSLMMVGLATVVSTPIGVLAGVYLAEYGEESWFAQTTRFVTDIMLSAPSIVIGLFVLCDLCRQRPAFFRLGRFDFVDFDRHSGRRAHHR